MPSNFKRPQLGQAQLTGAQIGNAPTVDRAAHARADQISSNIDALNNIGSTVVKKLSDAEKAQNINSARRSTANMPSDIDNRVRRKAEEDGIAFRDLSNEQLNAYTSQAEADFYDDNGINDSKYAREAKQIGSELGIRTLGKLGQTRDAESLKYNKAVVTERTSVQANVLHKGGMDSDTFVDTLRNDLDLDSVAIGTQGEAKVAQLEGLLGDAIANGNPEVMGLLDSEEGKEYFKDIPEYKNLVRMGKNKSLAVINKKKQINLKGIEESGFAIALGSGFNTEEEVDKFLEEQLAPTKDTMYAPSSKSIFSLRNKLVKDAETSVNINKYRDAIAAGDNTFLSNSGLKKKDQDALVSKDATQQIGTQDFSPSSLRAIVADPEAREAFRTYSKSGKRFPEQIGIYFNEKAVGGWEGAAQKWDTFKEYSSLTGSRVNEIINKKSLMEMEFVGNLIDNDSIEKKDKDEALRSFRNDQNKGRDSYGHYASAESLTFLRTEEVQENIADFANDAPWTWDDNSAARFASRQISGNTSMFMAAGHDPEVALQKAKDLYNSNTTDVEMPDGSESVITVEFSKHGATVDNMIKVARTQPLVKAALKPKKVFNEWGGFVEVEQDDSRLSVRPSADYERTNEYQVYIDGDLVHGSRFTPSMYVNGLAAENKREEQEIISTHSAKRQRNK